MSVHLHFYRRVIFTGWFERVLSGKNVFAINIVYNFLRHNGQHISCGCTTWFDTCINWKITTINLLMVDIPHPVYNVCDKRQDKTWVVIIIHLFFCTNVPGKKPFLAKSIFLALFSFYFLFKISTKKEHFCMWCVK